MSQISLGIHPVWSEPLSESSLGAQVILLVLLCAGSYNNASEDTEAIPNGVVDPDHTVR